MSGSAESLVGLPQRCTAGKVRVAKAFDGRTLFGFFRDKVQFYPLYGKIPADPDILVFPTGKGFLDFSGPEYRLPADLVARVAQGRTVAVFDCSTEGIVHAPARTEKLHAYLQQTGLPPERCVYVTQDRSYEAAYRAYCVQSGWREPVRVLNYDYFIRLNFDRTADEGGALFEARRQAFEERSARRERRFICLNFIPRWNKVLFLLWLLEQGLWDKGFVSFGGFGMKGNRDLKREKMVRELRAVRGFETPVQRLVPYMKRLDDVGRQLIGPIEYVDPEQNVAKSPIRDAGLEEHDRSWFTVVTETEIAGPVRITEKPFKALLGFHPAIILGNPGSLKLLEGLGFRTFPSYFDQSYDEEPDPLRRFEMVASEVRRLCSLDEPVLLRMEQEVAETLVHNAWWGLVRLPQIYREETDRAFLDQVLSVLQLNPAAA